jgi:3-phosphoshikimate 1-carboxyvinyltransferase
VEPDASSASYPLAAAALCGGRVLVPGLGPGSLQGDAAFAGLLARMGAEVITDGRGTEVRMRADQLHGLGTVDLADLSDLVPTVLVTAAFAAGPTRVTGVGFIRHKESDRIGDLAAELRRAGVVVAEHHDGLEVTPANRPDRLRAASFATHHDHRLAMALALIGLRLPGVVVEDPDVVSKSWPGYWRVLDALAG